MAIGVWQIAIIALVLVVLFGRGKISALMGDVGSGIREFKAGLNPAEVTAETASKQDAEPEHANTQSQ